eukprot:8875871-Alexandrium_andersonii.AAC.1
MSIPMYGMSSCTVPKGRMWTAHSSPLGSQAGGATADCGARCRTRARWSGCKSIGLLSMSE